MMSEKRTVPVELRKGTDGIWIYFKSKSGKEAALHVGNSVSGKGIIGEIINQWAGEQFERPFHIEGRHDEIDISRLLEDERVRQALNDALVELARAERLHPVWPDNVMEQAGILFDCVDKTDTEALCIETGVGGSKIKLRHRITQTIAMGIRCLINLEVK